VKIAAQLVRHAANRRTQVMVDAVVRSSTPEPSMAREPSIILSNSRRGITNIGRRFSSTTDA
jgi:hypothetical protein